MSSRYKTRISAMPGGRYRVYFSETLAYGWVTFDGDGAVIDSEFNLRCDPAEPDRPLSRVFRPLHELYVRAGTSIVERLNLGDTAGVKAALAKCETAGPQGTMCEHLKAYDGKPWCGECGCPFFVKQPRECPDGRWTLEGEPLESP